MTFSVIALNASAFQLMRQSNASKIGLHTGTYTCHIKLCAIHESEIKISVSPIDTEGRCQDLKINFIAPDVFTLNSKKK